MSRELPSPPDIHQITFHAFLIASILATLAILASICASCHRKPKKAMPLREKTASLRPTPKADTMVAPPAVSIEADKQESEKQEKEITELQGEIRGPIYPSAEMSKSKRRLSISSSMVFHGKLPRIKTGKREKRKEEENTLWKKTIIMGEKNKVPPWEEEEEEGVEKYGGDSCSRNYRPRSLPVSPIKWTAGDEARSTEEV